MQKGISPPQTRRSEPGLARTCVRGVLRKAWLFCGSDRGGQRAAAFYTLVQSARLNGVALQVWLADVLAQIAEYQINCLDGLRPWNWERRLTA